MEVPMSSCLLEHLTWFDVQEYLKKENVILLPIGSLEQHGPHLPLATDSINVQFLATRAADACQVLVAPTIRPGVSFNHMNFPGTMTLRPETLVELICDMVESMVSHGFRKIVLLNGHGGNNAAIEVAAIKLKERHPKVVIGVLHSWLLTKEGGKVLECPIQYHADEGETSRMLVSAKPLVRMERAKKEIPHSRSGLFNFQITEVFSQTTFYGLPKTHTVTQSGIFGDATLATEEKGRILFDEAVKNLIQEIEQLKKLNLEDYVEG
jgi:creatinine amidohydrolase